MNSKLGVHIGSTDRAKGWDQFVVKARPAIVKSLSLNIVDDWQDKVIGEIREKTGAEPNIFLLGRMFLPINDQRLNDPPKNAREFFEELKNKRPPEKLRVFDAIEGYNEISHNSAEELATLAAFEAELARLLKGIGVAYAAGGFSTGHPSSKHLPDWDDPTSDNFWLKAYRPALEVADYFHIHEYGWPTMQTKQGEHCLRYRTLYGHMKDANLARPIIISECGLDKPKADDGWQKLRPNDLPEDDHKRLQEEFDNNIDAFYLDQLKWYDDRLQEDPFVVGATIFTWGGSNDWKSFEIGVQGKDRFFRKLTDYLEGQNQEPHPQTWKLDHPPDGPTVRIERAEITPTQLKVGETLRVTVKVVNTSSKPAEGFDKDNPPDNIFAETDTVKNKATPGTWRVGVDCAGRAEGRLDHPWRWGWKKDKPLQPGERRKVEGQIRLQQAGRRDFWVGLVEEHKAWHEDRLGRQTVTVTAEDVVIPEVPKGLVRQRLHQFLLNDEPFRFIGVNIRGLLHYGDPHITDQAFRQHSRPEHREQQLNAAVRDMGARVVRVFLPAVIEPEGPPGRNLRLEEAEARLRDSLTLIDSLDLDLRLIVAFANAYTDVPFHIMDEPPSGCNVGSYCMKVPLPGGKTMDILSPEFYTGEADAGKRYRELVDHITRQFKDESRIFAWELGNEFKVLERDTFHHRPDIFKAFVKEIVLLIRLNAPDHMVSPGIIGLRDIGITEQEEGVEFCSFFDMVTVHPYWSEKEGTKKAKWEEHRLDIQVSWETGLPLVVGEAGFKKGEDKAKSFGTDLTHWFGPRKDDLDPMLELPPDNFTRAQGYMPWGFMGVAPNYDAGNTRIYLEDNDYTEVTKVISAKAKVLHLL